MMDLFNKKEVARLRGDVFIGKQELNEAYRQIRALEQDASRQAMHLRHARMRVRELEAILAARQTNQRGAGEVAFDRIVREAGKQEQGIIRHTARKPAFVGGHAGEGGLQRHSIGKIYPLIVYGKDQWSFGDTRYHIMDARTGHTFLRSFDSSALAEGHAELIHSLNKQYGTDLRIAADGRFVNHHKGV